MVTIFIESGAQATINSILMGSPHIA
jgi:hypothetical protein